MDDGPLERTWPQAAILRTTNAIERLYLESRPRIKTQGSLPRRGRRAGVAQPRIRLASVTGVACYPPL